MDRETCMRSGPGQGRRTDSRSFIAGDQFPHTPYLRQRMTMNKNTNSEKLRKKTKTKKKKRTRTFPITFVVLMLA